MSLPSKTSSRSRSLPPRNLELSPAVRDRQQRQEHQPPSNEYPTVAVAGSVAAARARSPLGRAVSTSNLRGDNDVIDTETTFLDLRSSVLIAHNDEVAAAFRDVAREQIDADTLRELARFFRTTGPPASSRPSLDMTDTMGMAMKKDARRWSIQSLRTRRRDRTGRRTPSLNVQLPGTTVPRFTSAGHSYIAISVMEEGEEEVMESKPTVGKGVAGRTISLPVRAARPLAVPNELQWLKDTQALMEEEYEDEMDDQTMQSPSSAKDTSTTSSFTMFTPSLKEPMTPLTALYSHPPMFLEGAPSSSEHSGSPPGKKLPFSSAPTSPDSQRPDSASSELTKRLGSGSQPPSPQAPSLEQPQPLNKKLSKLIVEDTLTDSNSSDRSDSPSFMYSPSSPDGYPGTTPTPRHTRTTSTASTYYGDPADLGNQTPVAGEHRSRSPASTTADSELFETASESFRYSMQSDTETISSFSTATSTRGRSERRRDRDRDRPAAGRWEAMDILSRKKSSRFAPNRQSWASTVGGDDNARMARSERSSILSDSSIGTVTTSASGSLAAERRTARKAKIREKFQRDLHATKTERTSHSDRRRGATSTEPVDSPILGRFLSSSEGSTHRTSVPGPSPLGAQASDIDDQDESWSRHVSRRSSVHDVAQFIPYTVPEDGPASPSTPRAPGFQDAYEEAEDKAAGTPKPLTLTSVMVVADIGTGESSSSTSTPTTPSSTAALRPLSLLNPGLPSPITPGRLPFRSSEGKLSVRQRPLPIKIATGMSTSKRSNRKSFPSMPTPPSSAESPSSLSAPLSSTTSMSKRLSLPVRRGTDPPPQTASSHPWVQQSLLANFEDATEPGDAQDRETRWLQAHQRETAQEWRAAALRERARLGRLAGVAEDVRIEALSDERYHENDGEDTDDDEVSGMPMHRCSTRSVASSTTKRKNRLETLQTLNANAGRNSHPLSDTASSTGDSTASGSQTPGLDLDLGPAIEERLERLERSGDVWLSVVMPLLQDMNSMLRDMKKETIGEEMTKRIMDSALAAGLMDKTQEQDDTKS